MALDALLILHHTFNGRVHIVVHHSWWLGDETTLHGGNKAIRKYVNPTVYVSVSANPAIKWLGRDLDAVSDGRFRHDKKTGFKNLHVSQCWITLSGG
jgi:hypothetical protein